MFRHRSHPYSPAPLGHEAIKLDLVPSSVAGILQGVSNTIAALGGVIGGRSAAGRGTKNEINVSPSSLHVSLPLSPLIAGVPAAAYISEETESWRGVFLLIVAIYGTAGTYFALRAKAEPVPSHVLTVTPNSSPASA